MFLKCTHLTLRLSCRVIIFLICVLSNILSNNFIWKIFSISHFILIIDESNYKFAMDQIICITSLKLNVFLLKIKCFSFKNIFNSLNSNICLTNNEYNYNVSTDQLIRKLFPNYGLKVYAPGIAFSMPINCFLICVYLQYFIYRSIMSDFF